MDQIWLISMVLGLLPVLWWWNEIWYVWPIKARIRWSNANNTLKVPPGHLGFPILGETLSFQWFFNIVRRPDDFITSKKHKYGDNEVGAYRTHLYGCPSIIAISPALCKFILNSGSENIQSAWPTDKVVGLNAVLSIEGTRHDLIKSVVVNTFTRPEALDWVLLQVQPRIVAALELWSQMPSIKTFYQLKRVTLDCTLKYVVGIDYDAHRIDAFAKLYEDITNGFRAIPLLIPGTFFRHALKCRYKNIEDLKEELEKRKRDRDDNIEIKNLMDGLMQLKDKDGKHLKDEEVLDNVLNSILVAHISTATAITWSLNFLAKNPHVLQKLREENKALSREKKDDIITHGDIQKLKYTNKVVDETLRMANISGFTFRKATKDIEFKGYIIPKGWQIMVWLRQLHNDPTNFADPMCFNPDRWDIRPKHGTYLPFGGGVRFCPGSMLIRLNMAIFLHHLSIGYKWEMLNPHAPINYLSHPLPSDGLDISITKF